MMSTRAVEIAEKLNRAGVPPKFGPDVSCLLIKVMRALADGHYLTNEQADVIVSDVGIDRTEAEQFLRAVTERDAQGSIIGIVGLFLNQDWSHNFQVRGNSMKTWFAWDTLFIPLLLNETATVTSESPATKKLVRVTVSPDGVKETDPEDAIVSVVVLDPDKGEIGSVEEAWSQFCHQVYFFASREEAEEWTANRNDIEILTVDEAFELGRRAWVSVLAYA